MQIKRMKNNKENEEKFENEFEESVHKAAENVLYESGIIENLQHTSELFEKNVSKSEDIIREIKLEIDKLLKLRVYYRLIFVFSVIITSFAILQLFFFLVLLGIIQI